jgi:hypothetical protein
MMVEKSDRSAGTSGVGHRLLSPFQRSARSDEFKKTLLLELKTGRQRAGQDSAVKQAVLCLLDVGRDVLFNSMAIV